MLYETGACTTWRCRGGLPDLLKRFDTINPLGNLEAARHRAGRVSGPPRSAISKPGPSIILLKVGINLADREKKWNAFQADPEWHTKAGRDREERAPIVARVGE